MSSEESKYREFSHKFRNVLRLLKSSKVTLEEEMLTHMRNLVADGVNLKSNKMLADKYQIEQLLMRGQPALEGQGLSASISSTYCLNVRNQ